jgi:hypothetical protein
MRGAIDRIVRHREPEFPVQPHDRIARPPVHQEGLAQTSLLGEVIYHMPAPAKRGVPTSEMRARGSPSFNNINLALGVELKLTRLTWTDLAHVIAKPFESMPELASSGISVVLASAL